MEPHRVRVITLFLTTLILNVLAETSWGQPFETYDLRVNGTVIMAIQPTCAALSGEIW
jgi:hypothetical protein